MGKFLILLPMTLVMVSLTFKCNAALLSYHGSHNHQTKVVSFIIKLSIELEKYSSILQKEQAHEIQALKEPKNDLLTFALSELIRVQRIMVQRDQIEKDQTNGDQTNGDQVPVQRAHEDLALKELLTDFLKVAMKKVMTNQKTTTPKPRYSSNLGVFDRVMRFD